jgi:hypothetical protein
VIIWRLQSPPGVLPTLEATRPQKPFQKADLILIRAAAAMKNGVADEERVVASPPRPERARFLAIDDEAEAA